MFNYLLNESEDRVCDKFHPNKRTRFFVVNPNPSLFCVRLIYLLGSLSILISTIMMNYNFYIILVFQLNAFFYNVPLIRLKDRVVIDFISESINPVLRFLFGLSITELPFLMMMDFCFLIFLVACLFHIIKRYVDFSIVEEVHLYRPSLRLVDKKGVSLLLLSFTIGVLFAMMKSLHFENLLLILFFIPIIYIYYKESFIKKKYSVLVSKSPLVLIYSFVFFYFFLGELKWAL